MVHFVEEYSFRTDQWLSLKDKENVSNCDAVDFGFKRNWKKVMLLGRSPETLHWVEDAVRQSRHYCNLLNQPSSAFPNFSFSETGSLMLLWPYWACANIAQGNSIKRQHLLWVYPTERTETRLLFFLICLFICYIFMILLCCWVATAFKNNQSLYSFRKLDWFCE